MSNDYEGMGPMHKHHVARQNDLIVEIPAALHEMIHAGEREAQINVTGKAHNWTAKRIGEK